MRCPKATDARRRARRRGSSPVTHDLSFPVAGEALAPLTVAHIDPATLKLVAALMDDPNPIHFDTAAARAAGLGDRPVAQGPLTFGYLLVMAARAVGGHDGLRQARIRFLGNVFAGDRLECTGVIHEVTPDPQPIPLRCRAEAAGRPVAAMDATFLLAGAPPPPGPPSRT